MPKYRKMLVAFDGSPSAENALIQAFKLARDEKIWITVATVVPSYDGDMDLTGVSDIHKLLRRPGEKILSRAAGFAEKEGVLIKTVIEEGIPHERLLEIAVSENSSSLILMGRRGLSRIEKSLVGSTTARVIGHSINDVLVIPEGSEIGWQRILVATDGSRHSIQAAEKAIDIARSYKGSLLVLGVVDFPAEFYGEAPDVVEHMVREMQGFVSAVREKAEAAGVEASGRVMEGDAHAAITETARKERIQAIVLGSHGRTGIKRLLMGSVAEKVIGYAHCPTLVAKAT